MEDTQHGKWREGNCGGDPQYGGWREGQIRGTLIMEDRGKDKFKGGNSIWRMEGGADSRHIEYEGWKEGQIGGAHSVWRMEEGQIGGTLSMKWEVRSKQSSGGGCISQWWETLRVSYQMCLKN